MKRKIMNSRISQKQKYEFPDFPETETQIPGSHEIKAIPGVPGKFSGNWNDSRRSRNIFRELRQFPEFPEFPAPLSPL